MASALFREVDIRRSPFDTQSQWERSFSGAWDDYAGTLETEEKRNALETELAATIRSAWSHEFWNRFAAGGLVTAAKQFAANSNVDS